MAHRARHHFQSFAWVYWYTATLMATAGDADGQVHYYCAGNININAVREIY